MSIVLVIAPHADDEVLGCGGTIYKHVEQGDDVYIAVMTDASIGAPELFKAETIKLIRAEAEKAHKILGVKDTFFYDFPAPQLEQFPQYKIANTLNSLIKKYSVDTLYIPHKGDLHLDHGVIFNASLVAARPFPEQTVKNIYAYETLSETEWSHPTTDSYFIPRHFNSLSELQFMKKLEAMKCFASQLKPFPNTRSIKALEHLAALRGATIGSHYAESFDIIRIINK